MPSILIVCTANICRSPMAEAILRRIVSARPDADEWRIDSAGVWAQYGNSAAPMSQFVMETMGMDISAHHSKPVSLRLLSEFDLILTMEMEHREILRLQFSELANRIFMLSEIIGISEDIGDPIGGELEDYQATANELELILSDGISKIVQLTHNEM